MGWRLTADGLRAPQITVLGLTYGSWGIDRYGTKPTQASPHFYVCQPRAMYVASHHFSAPDRFVHLAGSHGAMRLSMFAGH